jgi:hypothetical protein
MTRRLWSYATNPKVAAVSLVDTVLRGVGSLDDPLACSPSSRPRAPDCGAQVLLGPAAWRPLDDDLG